MENQCAKLYTCLFPYEDENKQCKFAQFLEKEEPRFGFKDKKACIFAHYYNEGLIVCDNFDAHDYTN